MIEIENVSLTLRDVRILDDINLHLAPEASRLGSLGAITLRDKKRGDTMKFDAERH